MHLKPTKFDRQAAEVDPLSQPLPAAAVSIFSTHRATLDRLTTSKITGVLDGRPAQQHRSGSARKDRLRGVFAVFRRQL